MANEEKRFEDVKTLLRAAQCRVSADSWTPEARAVYELSLAVDALLTALSPPAERGGAEAPPADDMVYDHDALKALDAAQDESYDRIDSMARCLAMKRGSSTVTAQDIVDAKNRDRMIADKLGAERDALKAEVGRLRELIREASGWMSDCGRDDCHQVECVTRRQIVAALQPASSPAIGAG